MVAVAPFGFLPSPSPSLRPVPVRLPVDGEQVEEDQRLVIHDVPWDTYVAVNDALGDRPGVRVCYCEGTLELMCPAFAHEDKKKRVARFLELYAFLYDITIYGLGSMTYRKKQRKRGAEPDECYFVNKLTKGPPHLALEVAISRGMLDKFSLYGGLGVGELWVWEDERLVVYHLGKSGNYRESKRSRLFPDLDVEELTSFVLMPDQASAVKAYGKRLQKRLAAGG